MADSDFDVKPKQVRKRKEKKVWPVGKNGIKKRRVLKTRKEVNAKGWKGELSGLNSDYINGTNDSNRSFRGLLRL